MFNTYGKSKPQSVSKMSSVANNLSNKYEILQSEVNNYYISNNKIKMLKSIINFLKMSVQEFHFQKIQFTQ